MWKLFTKKRNKLDEEIDYIVTCLRNTNPATEGYQSLLDELERLNKVRDAQKAYTKVKAETLVKEGVFLAGLLVVLHYEKFDVIASKAFNQITRWRV